ncbi:POTRA domain protein, FtsQ-type [Peptoanaerobacter stomatis]|uniref:POTRA domain protein, FtsQ-type n=1 Tax=Peptoanaerobacter stomatis TaxID=796937 RepID=J6HAG7_9FIRM|nr:FtsQ-type POTRA domain-containing protein [Peptoanaerobacter stomatis]EJU22115.1 POTRA domain protein, FtsQ-type [Peptoanaerobacter stomatis]NWO24891.1 FtsQ-type POTRA domain-containing protein [Peptostreptococcaceae bacterium oral taxon 081]
MKKKVTMSFFGILIIFLISVLFYLFSGRYSVNKITILGQTNLTKDKILELAKIDMNKNIYIMNTKNIEKNLTANNYIQSATVRRKFPQEITISIVERIPVASIPITSGYVIIDENATAISIVQDEKSVKKPIISGISISNIKLKDTIPVKDKDALENILKIIHLISSLDLLDNISYIDLKNYDDISMTTNTGILVRFGNTDDMQYKVKVLNKILINLSTKGKTSGTIDMRFDTDPVYYE